MNACRRMIWSADPQSSALLMAHELRPASPFSVNPNSSPVSSSATTEEPSHA